MGVTPWIHEPFWRRHVFLFWRLRICAPLHNRVFASSRVFTALHLLVFVSSHLHLFASSRRRALASSEVCISASSFLRVSASFRQRLCVFGPLCLHVLLVFASFASPRLCIFASSCVCLFASPRFRGVATSIPMMCLLTRHGWQSRR